MGGVIPDLRGQAVLSQTLPHPVFRCGNENMAPEQAASTCNDEDYVPPTCMRTLRVRVIFVQKSDGTGNFTADGPPMNAQLTSGGTTYNSSLPSSVTGQVYAENLIDKVNILMDNNTPDNMCDGWYYKTNPDSPFYDPLATTPAAPPPSMIRYQLDGVFYFANTLAYFGTILPLNLNSITSNTYDVSSAIELYVFANSSPPIVDAMGVGYGSHTAIYNQMNENGLGPYAAANQTHELGHTLGLHHTFVDFNCTGGCDNTNPLLDNFSLSPSATAATGVCSFSEPYSSSYPYGPGVVMQLVLSTENNSMHVRPQYSWPEGIPVSSSYWHASLGDEPEEFGSNIMSYNMGTHGHHISPCQLVTMHNRINSNFMACLVTDAMNLFPLVSINNNGSSLEGVDDHICVPDGTQVTLDAGNSWPDPETYVWSTGETTQTITVTAVASTTGASYSVTVSSNGCVGSDNVIVTGPPPQVELSDGVFCVNNIWAGDVNNHTITLTPQSVSPSNVSYQWGIWNSSNLTWNTPLYFTYDDPATPLVDEEGYHIYGDANNILAYYPGGKYAVTVTAENGCTASSQAEITLHHSPAPAVTPTYSTSGLVSCSDEDMVLTAIPNPNNWTLDENGNTIVIPDADYVSYIWDNGSTTNPSILSVGDFEQNGYYVTVTDVNGCTGIGGEWVTWVTPPDIDITGNTTICGGGSATLSVSINNPGTTNSFLWSNGATTQNITVTTPGTYSVIVTSEYDVPNGNIYPCSTEASITVTNTPPIQPILNPLPQDMCLNGTPLDLVPFVANFSQVSGGSFIITNNGVVVQTISASTSAMFNPSLLGLGTYNIQYTYSLPGCDPAYSTVQSVSVLCCPPELSTTALSSYCIGQDVSITGSPAGGTFTLITPTGDEIQTTDNTLNFNAFWAGDYFIGYTLPIDGPCPDAVFTQIVNVAMCCLSDVTEPINTAQEVGCCEMNTPWLISANNPQTTPTTPDLQWTNDNYAYRVLNSGTWTNLSNELKTVFGTPFGGVLRVNADIIIPYGKTVTMTNITINFGPRGRIIVEKGGTLNLGAGCHLLGECAMWQGIRVEGPGYGVNRSSLPINYGVVSMNGICSIKHAVIGIAAMKTPLLNLYDMGTQLNELSVCSPPNALHCQNIFPVVLQANTDAGLNSAGGVVRTAAGEITACFQGINLSWYSNASAEAIPNCLIEGLVFNSDDPLRYPFNSGSLVTSRSETGIYSVQYYKLIVRFQTFNNIKYGIQGFQIGNWTIRNNNFLSCRAGISIANDQFSLNSSHIFTNTISGSTIGIQALGGSIKSESNHIAGLGMMTNSVGTAAVNSHFSLYDDHIEQTTVGLLMLNNSNISTLNLAHECSFEDNVIGSWFVGDNGSSQLRCNQFAREGLSILATDDIDGATLGIVADQGFCFEDASTDTPADNIFTDGLLGADLLSDIDDPFTYFHRNNPALTPTIFNTPGAGAVNGECTTPVSEPNCTSWLSESISDGGDEKRINYLLLKKMDYYLSQTKDTAAALALLYSVNTDFARYLKIGAAMEKKEYAEAENLKNQLTATDQEALRYKQLLSFQKNLAVSGRSYLQITDAEETLLREIAGSHTQVAMDARVILYIARGEEIFINLPQLPAFVNNSMNQIQLHFKADMPAKGSIKLLPNPAQGTATLSYHLADNETAVFEIFDLNGKMVYRQNIAQQGSLYIDLSNFASGVYHYRVLNGRTLLANNKLVVVGK